MTRKEKTNGMKFQVGDRLIDSAYVDEGNNGLCTVCAIIDDEVYEVDFDKGGKNIIRNWDDSDMRLVTPLEQELL